MTSRTFVKTVLVKTDNEVNEIIFDLQLETRAVIIACNCVQYSPDGTRTYNLVYHVPDQESIVEDRGEADASNDT